MNEQVAQLAVKVRNHDYSTFDGGDSQADVITSVLKQEIARLNDKSDNETEAAEKRSELRQKLGLSNPEELHVEEATDDVTDKQEELRQDILGDDDSKTPNF
jgi:hypothetical protein